MPFVKQIVGNIKIESSLSEKLKLTKNYVEADVTSEVHGVSHDSFKMKLRKISPSFKDSWDKSIQVAYDENMINHLFLTLFYNQEVFSMRQFMPTLLPLRF